MDEAASWMFNPKWSQFYGSYWAVLECWH
jgi:hypothetical protein